MRRIVIPACLAAIAMMGGIQAAGAEEVDGKSAGDIVVRLRGINVMPDGENGVSTTAGAPLPYKTDVDSAVVPEVDFSYFLTDNIALELIAATTNHDVRAKSTSGGANLDLGDVWLLPPTLTVQYHPMPKAQFSPYVGAGLNYTLFYGEDDGDAVGIDYDNSIGYALQAGVDVQLGGGWLLNADVKKLWLDTDVTVDLGGGTKVKADVDLDPWIVGVGVGYRF